jgi:hypothetical protein
MEKIAAFEKTMGVFHLSLIDRFQKIQQMSGKAPIVEMQETTYVIPGYTYELKCDNDVFYNVWVGANFERLFFIMRFATTSDIAKGKFKFAFGGAEDVGWNPKYEDVDGEVSIWTTRMTDCPLVSDPDEEGKATITRMGSFWAVDIAMMLQSVIRTAQREQIAPSLKLPEPL